MYTSYRLRRHRGDALSLLNAAIEAVNLAKEISSVTPAKAVFGSVGVLLKMIRVCFPPSPTPYSRFKRNQDSMSNEVDYVELGLACAGVCKALDWGMNGRKLDDLSQSVCEAILKLTVWVNPVTKASDNPLTTLLIAGPWQRSKERSSSRVGGARSLNLSMRTIRKRSPLGIWTSPGSFTSSTRVSSPLCVRHH